MDEDCKSAHAWAKELQEFFNEHYYTCTPQILGSLAESYAGGGSMTENIDKVGGAGTGTFAKEVIDIYIRKQSSNKSPGIATAIPGFLPLDALKIPMRVVCNIFNFGYAIL